MFGVCFDESSAENLLSILTKRRLELADKLALVFPSWEEVQVIKLIKEIIRKEV